ncbi:MAG: LysR substrate-binding domain-containing protein [Halieaceae bacterium]
MRYTLRQLQVFLATARQQNLSRAADSLAMSQSAASGALRDFEQSFGLELFDRIGKRLKINELGLSLQPKAEDLLERAQDLEDSLKVGGAPGHLRVGATLTIGNYLAVRMMADFRETLPQAELSLTVANTSSIAAQVAAYELDVGLIEGELRHSDLEISHWRDDELVVFAAPGHPFANLPALDDEQLLNSPWVVREPGSGTRQTFDRAMAGILPEMDLSLELQHTEAIKQAVAAGLGLGCLSRICLQEDFQRGSLVPVRVPTRDFRRRFSIVLRRDKYRGAGLKAWLALCQAQRKQA